MRRVANGDRTLSDSSNVNAVESGLRRRN
jgi:hypothetical protein